MSETTVVCYRTSFHFQHVKIYNDINKGLHVNIFVGGGELEPI